jgi:mannosyltransferase OCH1-like enzyme
MIPKTIHWCWLSDDGYPENIKKYLGSWTKYLPDYQIIKWDKDNFDISRIKWTKEAYEAKKYAFAADYIRFFALYNYGGIYLDSDVEVIRSFDPLLSCKSFIGLEYISIPEAAVIGAEKGNVWIKECLDYYDNRSFYDVRGRQKTLAVPIMMKHILMNHYHSPITDNGQIKHFEDLDLFPYQYFSPRNPYKNKVEMSSDTYCIHHSFGSWNNGRRSLANRSLHNILLNILKKQRYDELLYKYHFRKIKHDFILKR